MSLRTKIVIATLVCFCFACGETMAGLDDSHCTLEAEQGWLKGCVEQVFSHEEVDHPGELQGFAPVETHIVNLGIPARPVWFRIHLKNNQTIRLRRVLLFDYPSLDHLDLYVPQADGSYHMLRTGDALPFDNRIYFDRNFAFPIELPPSSTRTYYLRVETNGIVNLPLRFFSVVAHDSWTRTMNVYFGVYFGIVVSLVAFNLFIFFVVHDRAYLYYVLYNAALLGVLLIFSGYGFQFLWPDFPALNATASVYLNLFANFFGLHAARYFLDLPRRYPRMDRAMRYAGLANLLTCGLLPFLPFGLSVTVAYILSGISIAFLLGGGMRSTLAGYRPAIFYVLAHAPVMVFAFATMITGMGFLEKNFATEYGIYIANAAEVILFSMGLGYRIRSIDMERLQHMRESANARVALSEVRKELQIAEQILYSLLPDGPPDVKGASFAIEYSPMTRVGGDFYDFVTLDEHRFGVFIADVEGHGLPAAMYASMVKTIVSLETMHANRPERLLARVGHRLVTRRKQKFLTAAYAYFDLSAQTMLYARGGHPPALVHRRSTGELVELLPQGMVLGFATFREPELRSFSLMEGDRIVFCTDGILETNNGKGDFFGTDEMERVVREHGSASAESLARAIVDESRRFSHTHEAGDDITLIIVDIESEKTLT